MKLGQAAVAIVLTVLVVLAYGRFKERPLGVLLLAVLTLCLGFGIFSFINLFINLI